LVESRTGLVLAVGIGWPELANMVALVLVGGVLALVPALAGLRTPVEEALR
jgi:hypothetical protein